jgi:hypothetical protein
VPGLSACGWASLAGHLSAGDVVTVPG